MQDFLKGIKNLGTKAKSTIKDFFTVTPEEEAKGKKPNVVESTTKKMGDFFAPAAKKNADGTFEPQVRVRDFVRELPGAVGNVGKEIVKGGARFALSAGESIVDVPLGINELVNPGTKYKVPIYEPETIPGLGFLGPIESYQNQAKREIQNGEGGVKSFLKAGGNIAIDEPLGVAFKPLGLAVGAFIKSGGGKAVEESIQALAKSSAPEEIKTLLGSLGIGKKAVEELAEPLAKANTVDEVKAILGYADNVAPKAGKEAVEAVSRETKTPEKTYTYYHATPKSSASAIEKGGFNTDDVYVFDDPLAAEMYATAKGGGKPGKTGIPRNLNEDWTILKVESKTPLAKGPNGDHIPLKKSDILGVSQEAVSRETPKGVYGMKSVAEKEAVGAVSRETKAPKAKTAKEMTDGFNKEPDEFVYHTTSMANLKPISDKGLVPSKKGQYGPGTYFAPTEELTGAYGSSEGVMLRVRRDKLPSDFQEWPGEQGWTTKGIPSEAIEFKVKGEKEWKPITSVEKVIDGQVIEKSVPRETPKGVDGMKSIGEILQGGGKDIVPPKVPTAKGGKVPSGDPERRFITRTKEMAPEMADLLEGKYQRKSNKELVANAEKMIAEDYAGAEKLARTGVDDQAVAIANKLIEDELNVARKATDEATKNKAYALAADIANEAAKNLTEAGRAVQAASLLGKMTPEGMARYAARQIQKYNEQAGARTVKNFLGGAKKIPELTGEQLKEITDAMEAINKMEDGTDKARALQKLGEKIQSYIPSTIYQKILNVWKAGLLTGLKTTGVNVASNFSHAVSEIAKDIPASAVDKIVSLFTGKRTLVLTGKGTGQGAAEGVARGWDYLKTGFDERNIADKLDYKKVNFGKGPVAKTLKGYTDTVFGLLGAEDQPFYYAAKMRSLANQAGAMAKNEGLKGKAARDFAQKLIENPTDEMAKYATLDAETAVFQQDSWLAKKAQNLQKGLEIVLPFAKTPANVANAMINYSPVGIVKTIIENIGKGRFDQRLFAQGIGRGITGTSALAIGSALMANKMMNLSWPTSEKEREQWEMEGRLPNTIKIGDKWRNIGVLGPLGMVLIVGGHLRQGMEATGSFAGGLAQAAGGFGNALTEQSFLSGVNRAIDALKDPKRSFNGFASSLAGSIVPTLIADISRGMDQYERRTDGMIERIQSRIPGARKGLEPKVDAFGKKVETPNLFEVLADPTRPGNPTAEANDPVLKELRRLMDAEYPVTPTQIGPTQGYESLTDELNTKLWQTSGMYTKKEMERIMNSKQYDRYDDEQKSQVLDRVIQDAKTEARARIVIDALKGLSESEQKAKLSQMKEDGLLTRAVFDLYLFLKRKE